MVLNEAGSFEDLQVFRHGGLGDPEGFSQFSGGRTAAPQPHQHLAARWVGERRECAAEFVA